MRKLNHCSTKTTLGQTDTHGGSQAALPPTDRVSAPAPIQDNSSTIKGLTYPLKRGCLRVCRTLKWHAIVYSLLRMGELPR